MAKIYSIKISNFKGVKKLEQVLGITDIVCLIGRGDSGKSTILEAISAVLSPSWNLTFLDTDFFNGNISSPIEIEVSLYDIPKSLLQETKFGLFIRGLDKSSGIIHDEIKDAHEIILTLKLIVDKDLEPKWFVMSNRLNQGPIEIRANDRASFNVFLVSDYIDSHFSWSKGNPLYSLLKEEESVNEKTNVLIDAFREAKEKIDANAFNYLDTVTKKIITSASGLGVDIKNVTTTIDFRDISIKNGRICLHEDKVPFRQKGKGSKRLISIAIQTELAKSGGILLIDEIEQGLEPDRAQHLVNTLKNKSNGQVIITTHSRDVLVELQAENIYRVKKNNHNLYSFDKSLQACIRSNPEAFFSESVIVCEGPTEIGICRSLNQFRIDAGKNNASTNGVRFANGNGSTQVEYAKAFLKSGYKVCLFCDSNVESINKEKRVLIDLGAKIVDSEQDKVIEQHVFEELPWPAILELIEYRTTEKGEDSVKQSIEAKFDGEFPIEWKNNDIIKIRQAIFKASISKNNEWFKRTDRGEYLGMICCKYINEIKNKRLAKQFEDLSKWIDNA